MNLQCTVTLAVLTAGGSTPFDTVHLYSPSFSLVTLFKFSFGVDESTSLPPPTLVQVMLGWGFPVALQNRTVLFPSNKVTSAGATSTVGGSEGRNRTSYPVRQRYHVHFLFVLTMRSKLQTARAVHLM